MNRSITWLVASFLAAIIGAAGLIDSTADLLMLAPFASLLITLLIGLYPGESVIETLAQLLDGRAATRREAVSSFPRITVDWFGVPIAGTLGSRGPPIGT